MGVSLNLEAAVQLLSPLTTSDPGPSPSSSQSPSPPQATPKTLPDSESTCGDENRRLGDFTPLWAFLRESSSTNRSGEPARHSYCSRIPEPSESITSTKTTGLETPGIPTPTTPKILRRGQQLDGLTKSTPLQSFLQSHDSFKLAEVPKAIPLTPKRNTKKKTPENFSSVGPPESLTATKKKPVIKSSISWEQRKPVLVQKLLNQFPDNKSTILKPSRSDSTQPQSNDIHVFVDNSNISIGFIDHIKASRGLKTVNISRPVLSFRALSLILERGRPAVRRVLVGSAPFTREMIEAKEIGYETSILERVEKDRPDNGQRSASSGSDTAANKIRRRKVEQGVDEILHMKICESLLDHSPSTVVLASGDGNIAEYSPGFFKAIERCLDRNWRVEIIAFKNSLNSVYRNKEFRKKWKGKFRVILLDDFAEDMLS